MGKDSAEIRRKIINIQVISGVIEFGLWCVLFCAVHPQEEMIEEGKKYQMT